MCKTNRNGFDGILFTLKKDYDYGESGEDGVIDKTLVYARKYLCILETLYTLNNIKCPYDYVR